MDKILKKCYKKYIKKNFLLNYICLFVYTQLDLENFFFIFFGLSEKNKKGEFYTHYFKT